ncbi:MAG: L-histidine N(alpha)-methyltransferase [Pseudomonadota bacterium]|nr:L-histidine N(alpha)-methyltransferase [Pseudomonadota bacterium]
MPYDNATAYRSRLTPPGSPHEETLAEILHGLAQRQKVLPTRLLYDEQGSRWFEAICDLPEYYVTRAELDILRDRAVDIADFVGSDAALIEPGAGYGAKARLLLSALQTPRLYAPMDIDDTALRRCEIVTRCAFPELKIAPFTGDFQQPFVIPASSQARRRVIFFPGSTIGNFDPAAARRLLQQFRIAAGADSRLLIGVDLRKNPDVLRRAYDDAQGVTAAFNLNLLRRLNREYGAHFDITAFTHRAVYDKHKHRIEMHLVSRYAQLVRIDRRCVRLRRDETIHTENSYKYLPGQFAELAADAGWQWLQIWMDKAHRFGVLGFSA